MLGGSFFYVCLCPVQLKSEVMFIEEEVIKKTVRVRCNNIPFLVALDYQNKSSCLITRVSDGGAETVPYAKLILDRSLWDAAVELKAYIDKEFSLKPTGTDPDRRKREAYKFNPKKCSVCLNEYQPPHARSKICPKCLDVGKAVL